MVGALSPFYKPQQLTQILVILAGQFPLSYIDESLILRGVISHCPSIILISLSFKGLCFLLFYTTGIKNVLCRALCGVSFLELCERMSRLLKLTLMGEVTVSQSVSVVAFKISSEVRPHPTNAKNSVTSTLKNRGKRCILMGDLVMR